MSTFGSAGPAVVLTDMAISFFGLLPPGDFQDGIPVHCPCFDDGPLQHYLGATDGQVWSPADLYRCVFAVLRN